MKNKYRIGILIFMAFMTLYGCGNVLKGENIDTNKNVNLAPDDDLSMDEKQSVAEGNNHVNHTNSGIVPKGVKKAQNPTYPVGSQVIIQADHMVGMKGAKVTLEADHLPGMKGAIATVESGIHTTVYMVNYKPTNGTSDVKNHKWLIESEIEADQS